MNTNNDPDTQLWRKGIPDEGNDSRNGPCILQTAEKEPLGCPPTFKGLISDAPLTVTPQNQLYTLGREGNGSRIELA